MELQTETKQPQKATKRALALVSDGQNELPTRDKAPADPSSHCMTINQFIKPQEGK